MADFQLIKQEIDDNVNTNGVGAITGAILNTTLNDMVDAINAAKTDILPDGTLYGGFAWPNEPPTYGDDHRYFYIAYLAGSYPAFDTELAGNMLAIFYWLEDAQEWTSNYLTMTPTGIEELLSSKMDTVELYTRLGFLRFSPYSTYNVGDYVVNEGFLYRFTSNHPAGQWDDNDVEEVTLIDYIDDLLSVVNDKADKVSGATNGHFAGLNASGNLTDSGSKASDFATAAQGGKADTAVQPGDLATVATSGSYNDLLNKPTIPAAQVNSDWNANSGVAQILNKPTIPDVSGKADKVVGANSGDVATLDGTGNITDSGLSVFDFFVMVEDASTPPASMAPNTVYQYGTLAGNTTFPPLATPTEPDIANVYCWTFATPATAPTITWPVAITDWAGGSAPTINASKKYEVSVMDGLATIIEA